MGGQENRCQLTTQKNEFASPKVLSNFYINDHHYVVICLEKHYETVTEQKSDYFLKDLTNSKDLTDSMVGQLWLDNQHCIIVEVESDSGENSKSDITLLLTERELQVVHLVAQGHSNKQVANQLHISEWTVSTHLRRVFAKLGVDSRAAMVYRCSSLLNSLN